jgi:hypothetical protein
MTGQSTLTVGMAGTLAASLAGGPLSEVFNELGLVLGIMGAFGGVAIGAHSKYPWPEVFRSGFVGGLLAFGFGVISPPVLQNMLGIEVIAGNVASLAGGAFAIGFMQDVFTKWLRDKRTDQ